VTRGWSGRSRSRSLPASAVADEGAQRRLADLLATRYLESDGVPNAGTLKVFMPVAIAWRYRDAGDYDRAMEWLEKAYEAHDPSLAYLGQPVWGPLRSSPRFQSLLRRVGLPSADMQGKP